MLESSRFRTSRLRDCQRPARPRVLHSLAAVVAYLKLRHPDTSASPGSLELRRPSPRQVRTHADSAIRLLGSSSFSGITRPPAGPCKSAQSSGAPDVTSPCIAGPEMSLEQTPALVLQLYCCLQRGSVGVNALYHPSRALSEIASQSSPRSPTVLEGGVAAIQPFVASRRPVTRRRSVMFLTKNTMYSWLRRIVPLSTSTGCSCHTTTAPRKFACTEDLVHDRARLTCLVRRRCRRR